MKKNFVRRIFSLTLAAAVALTTAACGGAGASGSTPAKEAGTVIKVGANITPHAEILEQAKPILAEKGITLEIVKLEDSITPNTGVIEGSLDANYFQHVPYLEQFNKENGSDLVSIGAIHYEPFGIYAGKTADLAALPEGALVAVPNNVTNEARALLLLAQEGIISLKEDAGINATVEDITACHCRRYHGKSEEYHIQGTRSRTAGGCTSGCGYCCYQRKLCHRGRSPCERSSGCGGK